MLIDEADLLLRLIQLRLHIGYKIIAAQTPHKPQVITQLPIFGFLSIGG